MAELKVEGKIIKDAEKSLTIIACAIVSYLHEAHSEVLKMSSQLEVQQGGCADQKTVKQLKL